MQRAPVRVERFPFDPRPRLSAFGRSVMAASKCFNAHAVFADLEAAHAFLDVAEQAREGTVFLRGVEAAKGALEQLNAAVIEMPDPELVLARDRLKHRIERLVTTMSGAS